MRPREVWKSLWKGILRSDILSTPGEMCGVWYLYFSPATAPVDSLHPGSACPAGRWPRTSTLLGSAVHQCPLGHHLRENSEGKITNPVAFAAAVATGRGSWSPSLAAVFFIPSRMNRESGIPSAVILGSCRHSARCWGRNVCE